jgi:hypothetical protein
MFAHLLCVLPQSRSMEDSAPSPLNLDSTHHLLPRSYGTRRRRHLVPACPGRDRGSRMCGVGGSGSRRHPKNSPPTLTQEILGILPMNPISSPPSPIQSIADSCVSISSTTPRAPSTLTSCWTSCARRPRIVSTSCRGGRQVFSFYLFFKVKTAPLSFTCFYVECVS